MIAIERDIFWTREHDKPGAPLLSTVPLIAYPTELEDLIAICQDPQWGPRLRAVGSHWALSEAAVSDHTFIETHDRLERFTAMGATLDDILPDCLSDAFVQHLVRFGNDNPRRFYPVHVEAGKRIYQLYSELDQSTEGSPLEQRLRAAGGEDGFIGPWALATLGGAAGQTIVGALNTGTHGGDFDRPPVADSVLAIHLVTDGGKHWWIEPETSHDAPELIEEQKIRAVYGKAKYGGPANFDFTRNTELFNAVLVSCGRFGIIYSVVLKAIPQHMIFERRRLHVWQDLKNQIIARDPGLFADFADPADPDSNKQRFLQIAVCLTPHAGFGRNLVGVTKRWTRSMPADGIEPVGRAQRRGRITLLRDPTIKAPRFEMAGRSHGLTSNPDKHFGSDPGLLETACKNASFIAGLIDLVIDQVEEWIENGTVTPIVAAITVVGGGGLVALAAALLALLALLKEILEAISEDTLGQAMDKVRDLLLDVPPTEPAKKAAGLFLWQAIAYAIFQEMQGDDELTGISYAVMDRKDYLQQSCEENVDSVEVFFPASDSRLLAFVDALLAFEIQQEIQGKAFLGYASLRFMGPSRAFLGEQRGSGNELTCAIEIACLRDMKGSQEVVDFATALALNRNYGALLHWGQKNTYTKADVEVRFGVDLDRWRQALATVTAPDDRFSSDFSRRTGLEIV